MVVTLNVDGLEFDTLKNGAVSHRSSSTSKVDAVAKAVTLLGTLNVVQAPGKSAALGRLNTMTSPEVTLRLTREGVVKLSDSDHVRSIKPVGFKDARLVKFDAEALSTAQRTGFADVIITARTPLLGGRQSAASFAAQTQAHKRALDGLLSDTGVTSKLQDISEFGVKAGRLSFAELTALNASQDARLLSVELNRPMATPSMATSTVTMNMPPYWNAGSRAAGQNIVVLDTGVQTNHEFFKDANGVSRVFFEGCYGTSALSGGVQYESNCPQQGTGGAGPGDSPAGLVGSAAPRLNCSSTGPSSCLHGTHVAGTAAGRVSALLPPTGLQGVAPDARIAAIQVFSFDQARVKKPVAFYDDLILVMEQLANIMTPGTVNNPFVINMSLGGNQQDGTPYTVSCPGASTAFTTAVQTLFSLGVPVIAATGNNGSDVGISWPACVPQVIKVSAVNNDSAGNTRAWYANLTNPSAFPGDFFWLAPGGDGTDTGGIRSAIPDASSSTQTGVLSGTSQATPHIAGLYAVLKAVVPTWPINDISNWIQANASVPVTVNLCASSGTPCPTVFRRPRLP